MNLPTGGYLAILLTIVAIILIIVDTATGKPRFLMPIAVILLGLAILSIALRPLLGA